MAIPAYATLDDLRDKDHTPPEWSYIVAYKSSDDPLLGKLLLRASRVFDILAFKAPGYFKATSGVASQMVVVGDGTNYLRMPIYVPGTLGVISVPSGYQLPSFAETTDELGQQWLIRTDASGVQAPTFDYQYYQGPVGSPAGLGRGWAQGVPVTITAQWGFEETPEDVVESVIELTAAIYRSRDALAEKTWDLNEISELKKAAPERVKEVASKYSKKSRVFLA